jgi:hypothetical protein
MQPNILNTVQKKNSSTILRIVTFSLFIGNGGISVFLVDNGGLITNNVADALNSIGAIEAERILKKSFKLLPNSVIPEDEAERQKLLGIIAMI